MGTQAQRLRAVECCWGQLKGKHAEIEVRVSSQQSTSHLKNPREEPARAKQAEGIINRSQWKPQQQKGEEPAAVKDQ